MTGAATASPPLVPFIPDDAILPLPSSRGQQASIWRHGDSSPRLNLARNQPNPAPAAPATHGRDRRHGSAATGKAAAAELAGAGRHQGTGLAGDKPLIRRPRRSAGGRSPPTRGLKRIRRAAPAASRVRLLPARPHRPGRLCACATRRRGRRPRRRSPPGPASERGGTEALRVRVGPAESRTRHHRRRARPACRHPRPPGADGWRRRLRRKRNRWRWPVDPQLRPHASHGSHRAAIPPARISSAAPATRSVGDGAARPAGRRTGTRRGMCLRAPGSRARRRRRSPRPRRRRRARARARPSAPQDPARQVGLQAAQGLAGEDVEPHRDQRPGLWVEQLVRLRHTDRARRRGTSRVADGRDLQVFAERIVELRGPARRSPARSPARSMSGSAVKRSCRARARADRADDEVDAVFLERLHRRGRARPRPGRASEDVLPVRSGFCSEPERANSRSMICWVSTNQL